MDINNPSIVTIIWIERGILFTCINIIEHNYLSLFNKKIIVNNSKIKKILKILFPELLFKNFKSHSSKNFYINIRNIVYHQDYIIDYLNNYDTFINSKHINLVPWYDSNDPLIVYKFDKSFDYDVFFIKNFVQHFTIYIRSNFKNDVWDVYLENKILHKYANLSGNNIYKVLNFINHKLSNYLKHYNNQPIIINNIQDLQIKNNDLQIKNNDLQNKNNDLQNKNNDLQNKNNIINLQQNEIANLKNIIKIISSKIKKINNFN
jgi:FtsZ-binding cell division protein ZapB